MPPGVTLPALELLAAVGRLVGASNSDSGACQVLRAASDQVLGSALQAALREQLRVCLHAPSTSKMRQLMRQASMLLGEMQRRETDDNGVDLALLRVEEGDDGGSKASWLRVQASVAACVACAHAWQARGHNAPRKHAARLASHLQDAVCALLEYAGRADADDPRQTDWLELVASPAKIDADSDAHAAAIIGAALWVTSRKGRLRAWQLLAWRLWTMAPEQLADIIRGESRWWPSKRPSQRCPSAGKALLATHVVTCDPHGRYFLRPRRVAMNGCLAILRALRYDAAAGAKDRLLIPDVPGPWAVLRRHDLELRQQNHSHRQPRPQA